MNIDANLLNKRDCKVLRLIRLAHPLTAEEIAEILGLEIHEVTYVLSFLTGLGAIKVTNSPTYSPK